MQQLFTGTGRCDITPAPGTLQGGWGAQIHQRGVGSDMPFYATAVVLDYETEATPFSENAAEALIAARDLIQQLADR